MWKRFKEWWKKNHSNQHHHGCGGRWIELGTSGFAVLRIHFRCDRCGVEGYYLHSPGD